MKTALLLPLMLVTTAVFADEHPSAELLLAQHHSAQEEQKSEAAACKNQASWFVALVHACGKTGSLDAYALPMDVANSVNRFICTALELHNERVQRDEQYAHDYWS